MKQPEKHADMMRNTIWILFSKYFAGECNNAETEKLNHLLEKSASYRKLFTGLKSDNELIDKYKKMKTVDVDKAWNKISQRIQAVGGDKLIPGIQTPVRKLNVQRSGWIAVAASILLIAGLFFAYRTIFNSKPGDEELITAVASGTEIPVTLPDGSKVYLNRDSRISYPYKFSNKTRVISLSGEAFFEVVPDTANPFVVKAGKARVKVLGTSFSVNERAGRNLVEVFVESGKVQIYREETENQGLLLEPGYVGHLAGKTTNRFPNQNENIIAWKTKKIVFSQTRLAEVITVLKNVYGEQIRCENREALDWPYTNTFDNQDFQAVINVLAETFQFNVSKDQAVFVLSGGIN